MQPIPINCEASFCQDFLNPETATNLFDEIVNGFDVTNKAIKMADGSEYFTETGVYLFMDEELTSFEAFPETWGGRSKWIDSLENVRDKITEVLGVRYPVARCVYYRDGSEGMEFHSDPPAYGDTNSIASLSLGAEREFVLRSIEDKEDQYKIMLSPGSLLHMGENCQQRYEHGVPRSSSCSAPRLNITFRKYGWDS